MQTLPPSVALLTMEIIELAQTGTSVRSRAEAVPVWQTYVLSNPLPVTKSGDLRYPLFYGFHFKLSDGFIVFHKRIH